MNKLELNIQYIINNNQMDKLILPSMKLNDTLNIFNRDKLMYGDIYFSTFNYCCYIVLTESKKIIRNTEATEEMLFSYFSLFLFDKDAYFSLEEKSNNIKKFYELHDMKKGQFIYLGNYYLNEFEDIDNELNRLYSKYEVMNSHRNKIKLNQVYSSFEIYFKKEFEKMMEISFYNMNEFSHFKIKNILENESLFNQLKDNKLSYFLKSIFILNFKGNSLNEKHHLIGNEYSNYKIIKDNEIVHNYYICLNEYGSITLFDLNKGDILSEGPKSKKVERLHKSIKDRFSDISITLPNETIIQEIIYANS